MGMDLSGAGGYFRWNIDEWIAVLDIAQRFGWEPIGTGPPRGTKRAEWCGTYYSNDGQLFYARDALRLADALERVFSDEAMPELRKRSRQRKFEEGKEGALKTMAFFMGGSSRKNRKQRDSWLASDAGIQELREFIEYCRAGSFRIY